jgi:thymidylate synthase (FAD)
MKAEYITHSGDDLLIVNAARVSFSKESEFDWIETDEGPRAELSAGDTKLINYLARHNHWTPFSHPQITVRETVPIFVARQRFKHMVGFTYNEVSRRYVDDVPEFFYPDVWRSRPEGGLKQGSGKEAVVLITHDGMQDTPANHYRDLVEHARELYIEMVADGVAPEQARMVLPQSMYTSYYVTGSLAAWARAYKQRIDAHAQVEIQDLAKQWNDVLAPLFPVSWKVLTEN